MTFPKLCSPKFDGIRSIVKEGRCKSRTYIDLPSRQFQEAFSECENADGEFIVGNATDFNVYNRTDSHVMSRDKPAEDISYYVFDDADMTIANMPFEDRLESIKIFVATTNVPGVKFVEHHFCNDLEEMLWYENEQLALGYEGIMMRNPLGIYKHGRATYKQDIIYKLKRFQDTEGVVVGFVEKMLNTNEDIRDNLGGAKRSTAKAGLVPAGTLGKLIVDFDGDICNVGLGCMKHDEAQFVWNNQELFLGKYAKCRSFGHGVKDKPRHQRFVGWRNLMDM